MTLREAERRRRAPAVALTPANNRAAAGAALLVLLLGAAACARQDAASTGRFDVQAAANCAPFEDDQAAYDSCVADEKRRLNAAAINTLSNVSGQQLLTVPLAGGMLHH